MSNLRLAIMGSTRGTALLALIRALRQGNLEASIELVISNRPGALILDRASSAGLHAVLLSEQHTFERDALLVLQRYSIDLIVLIGYMRILSAEFVAIWHNKIINVHPSLLPEFAGLRDVAVHEAVLKRGDAFSGCSVHYVTEEVDNGPIIVQCSCPVFIGDSVDNLKSRVQALEAKALIKAIQLMDKNKTK